MKIEIGESLIYSWLRHVKGCQIVQTNWKTSKQWQLLHEEELSKIMQRTSRYFEKEKGYDVYKKTASLSQLLQQTECDAIGIDVQDGNKVYAVEVAFHEGGLNYGGRETTVKKVIAKCLRAAMAVYGYLDIRMVEVVFTTPKVAPKLHEELKVCIDEVQQICAGLGYKFTFRVIAGEDFRNNILAPVIRVSEVISDTSELFVRSLQMLDLYNGEKKRLAPPADGDYSEFKVGKIAQTFLRTILEESDLDEAEIAELKDKTYCSRTFGLTYPLLVEYDSEYERVRYYADPVKIHGTEYMMCSQWFESDRPYLVKWIAEHGEK